MTYLHDLTHNSNDLPLHKLVIDGKERQALKLIEKYKVKAIKFVRIVLENPTLTHGKVIVEDKEIPINFVSATRTTEYIDPKTGNVLKEIVTGRLPATFISLTQFQKHSQGFIDPNGTFSAGDIKLTNVEPPIYLQLGPNKNSLLYIDRNTDSIHLQNHSHQSALHLAAERGMIKVVEALIKKGVNINLRDGYGLTALHYASKIGNKALIKLIIENGGEHRISDAKNGARPIDLFSTKEMLDIETIRLLNNNDPYHFPAKLTDNELHYALKSRKPNYSVNEIAVFGLDPTLLVRDSKGKLPSELAKTHGKIELASHFVYRERLHYLTFLYNVGLYTKDNKNKGANDLYFLKLLIESIELIQSINTATQLSEIQFKNLEDGYNLLATIIHCITYDLKKDYYDLIPWANIEYIRSVIHKKSDLSEALLKDYLVEFTKSNLPSLKDRFILILKEKEIWYSRDTSDFPVKRFKELELLFELTDPLIDSASLKKLLEITDAIQSCSTSSEQGRYAILKVVKHLGELSKYTQFSRNLSDYAKGLFPNIPWEVLYKLRNMIAKNTVTPSVRKNYYNLLKSEDNSLFKELKEDISEMAKYVKTAYEQHQKLIYSKGLREEFYKESDFTPIRLNQIEKDKLLKDLQSVYQAIEDKITKAKVLIEEGEERAKAEGKAKNKVKNKQEIVIKTLQRKLSEKTKLYNECTQIVRKLGFNKRESEKILNFLEDANKKKWNDLFTHKLSETSLKSFDKLKAVLEKKEPNHSSPISPEAINEKLFYCNLALKIIDKLQIFLINNKEIIEKVKKTKFIANLPSEDHLYVYERLKQYLSNPEIRYAAEQLVTDLYLALKQLNIDGNRGYRNFLEHINFIFETSDRPVEQGSFFEMSNYLLEIYEQVEKLKQTLHAKPSEKQTNWKELVKGQQGNLSTWLTADEISVISNSLIKKTGLNEFVFQFAPSIDCNAGSSLTGSLENVLNEKAKDLSKEEHPKVFTMALNISSEIKAKKGEGNHWIYCVIIAEKENIEKCLIINPLGNNYDQAMNKIKRIIMKAYAISDEKVECVNTSHQTDSINCGIWMLNYLEKTLNLLKDKTNAFNADHLIDSLKKNEISNIDAKRQSYQEIYKNTVSTELNGNDLVR
jgi:uncharacterized protein with HEPN domain